MNTVELETREETRVATTSEYVQKAKALLPELRERQNEIDHLRQLPQDLAEKMAEMGFYRLCAPEAVGGLNLGPGGMCQVVETLAGGNGSAAWCAFISSTSFLNLAGLDDDFRNEILRNPAVIVSAVFADSGTACYEERDGEPGYVINGHWRFGSSCRNAAWIFGALHEVDKDGETIERDPPISRVVFKPEELEILDNWYVSGLRGSGSSDYKARDVWVPARRVMTPNRDSRFASEPMYRFPLLAGIATPAGAIAMGMAQAALDEVLEAATTRTPTGSTRTLSMRPILHRDLAALQTELAAARCYFYACIDDAWEHAQIRDDTLEHRVKLRTANCHAVQVSIKVIDRMYTLMGGSSIYETSCLQAHFRDVHTASQHMMVAETVMELAGRVMIGLDDVAYGL